MLKWVFLITGERNVCYREGVERAWFGVVQDVREDVRLPEAVRESELDGGVLPDMEGDCGSRNPAPALEANIITRNTLNRTAHVMGRLMCIGDERCV